MFNHRFVESELDVKKGKEKIKAFEDKKTKSGNTILRHFCTDCVRTIKLYVISLRSTHLLHRVHHFTYSLSRFPV